MRDPQPAYVLDFRQRVGDRIRLRRNHQNLTQWQMVEATGINRTTYQDIERGTSDPRLGDLARIAQALQTTVSVLTDTQGPPSPR